MSRRRCYVGPHWPIKLHDYDNLRLVGNPDWAWEFLRRNPHYQRDQRLYQLFSERPLHHARGLLLTRTRRRCRRAEAWKLCSFRRPEPVSARCANHMGIERPSPNSARPRRPRRIPADADFRADTISALSSIRHEAPRELLLPDKTMSPGETLCRRVAIDRVAIIRSMLAADRCRTTTSANVPTNLLSHRSFPDTQNAKGR